MEENMRTVNSFSHSHQPPVSVIIIIFKMAGFHSYTHPERYENDKKTSLTGNKTTNLIWLKCVQMNDCGHKMHGRHPENNPPLPDTKQHLELAEHKQTLRKVLKQGYYHVSNLIQSEIRWCGQSSEQEGRNNYVISDLPLNNNNYMTKRIWTPKQYIHMLLLNI